MKGRLFKLLCLAPAVILFTVFMVYPALSIFYMSLFRWGGFSSKRTFVGLDNFRALARDERFILSLENQLFLIVVVTIVTLILALWFANTLQRERLRAKGFFPCSIFLTRARSSPTESC